MESYPKLYALYNDTLHKKFTSKSYGLELVEKITHEIKDDDIAFLLFNGLIYSNLKINDLNNISIIINSSGLNAITGYEMIKSMIELKLSLNMLSELEAENIGITIKLSGFTNKMAKELFMGINFGYINTLIIMQIKNIIEGYEMDDINGSEFINKLNNNSKFLIKLSPIEAYEYGKSMKNYNIDNLIENIKLL